MANPRTTMPNIHHILVTLMNFLGGFRNLELFATLLDTIVVIIYLGLCGCFHVRGPILHYLR